jgi:hypothetical protein
MTTPDAMSLKECTVSMVGEDGQMHEAAVEAASLFDAADRALQPLPSEPARAAGHPADSRDAAETPKCLPLQA